MKSKTVESGHAMPALFVGHGSPTNAIEDNEFSGAWTEMGRSVPRPKAILCISAHWETKGAQVTAMAKPKTIHDFQGFRRELYEIKYPAPGSPSLAQRVRDLISAVPVGMDADWGLDHGSWSVLRHMFPEADIPTVQLSLKHAQAPAFHYRLGQELRPLREEGVLIIGSGNIVHNLRTIVWQDTAFDWALEFDDTIRRLIEQRDHSTLMQYESLGPVARLSVPTNEHYLPMLYILALQDAKEDLSFSTEKVTLGSISMRSFRIG
jgi:4,5-DOPA dioxygenase extradiol